MSRWQAPDHSHRIGARLPFLMRELEKAKTLIQGPEPEGSGEPEPNLDDVAWCERVSGRILDPWQRGVITTTSPMALLNCSRQVGKTEVVSLKAALKARRYRRAELCLAPTLFQSSKVRIRAERWLLADGVRFVTKNATTLELVGGGSVIALPGDRPDLSARGEVADDLIVDEASRVKAGLIAASTPTTATRPDSTITYLSTPAGKRGEFYRAWQDEHWKKFSIKATECPRISKFFLARERDRLGDLLFSQEYECAFIADSSAVLDPEAIAQLFKDAQPQTKVDWTRPDVAVDWGTIA